MFKKLIRGRPMIKLQVERSGHVSSLYQGASPSTDPWIHPTPLRWIPHL